MDEERMSVMWFADLPAWGMLLSLSMHFAAGIGLGVLYFRSLWWTACRFAGGGRVTTTIAVVLGRFTLLGVLLMLASLEGAMPLLVMALGILIARYAVMRRIREATS
jgi:F1F0 ATPase subunit 2